MGAEGKASETREIFSEDAVNANPRKEKGKEKIRSDEEAEEKENEGKESAVSKSDRDDALILKSLFDAKEVEGSLSHDAVVNESNQENILVEMEGEPACFWV